MKLVLEDELHTDDTLFLKVNCSSVKCSGFQIKSTRVERQIITLPNEFRIGSTDFYTSWLVSQ